MSGQNSSSPVNVSRRHFLKITAAAGAVFLGGRWLQRQAEDQTHFSETRLLMGTLINLTLVADDVAGAQQVAAATFSEMERLIQIFNWRRPDSPLARLNETGRLNHPPSDLVDILHRARHYSELSGGAFDVTVQPLLEAIRDGVDSGPARQLVDYRRLLIAPQQVSLEPDMRVTLDGIAKGRVVDGAVAILNARGYANVLVEAGGDLVARGRRRNGQPWQVGITHPRRSDTPLDVLTVSGQAVATSGDYQHAFTRDLAAHHIVDPRRGLSPAELASVTVLAPTAADADALSTAVMVLGTNAGLDLIGQLPHVEALVVTKKMEIIRSAAFPTA